MTEREAIERVLQGTHPGNCFDCPYLLTFRIKSLKDLNQAEIDWVAAVPEDWHQFRNLLHFWFRNEKYNYLLKNLSEKVIDNI